MRNSSSAIVRRLCLPGIVLYGLLLSPVFVPAQSREYVVLQAPGCQYTIAWGVNESGDVVGNAYGCAGDLEAFFSVFDSLIDDLRRFERIRYPDAIMTEGAAIAIGWGTMKPWAKAVVGPRIPEYFLHINEVAHWSRDSSSSVARTRRPFGAL